MSTLSEIESAVDQLPLVEQEQLLRHLATRLRRQRGLAGLALREQWMNRLDELRASIDSGRQTVDSESILEESREERN
jgi:hypothetical protein